MNESTRPDRRCGIWDGSPAIDPHAHVCVCTEEKTHRGVHRCHCGRTWVPKRKAHQNHPHQ